MPSFQLPALFKTRVTIEGVLEGAIYLSMRNEDAVAFVTALPKTLRAKLFHRGIIGYERRTFDDGLCGEHPIKWVTMLYDEPACLKRMLKGNGKVFKSVGNDQLIEFADGPFGTGQFADAMFGGDLPSACGTDEHGIGLIGDGFSCAF